MLYNLSGRIAVPRLSWCCKRNVAQLTLKHLTAFLFLFLLLFSPRLHAQDSLAKIQHQSVLLKEVVVRNNLNVAAFIERIKNDTTFYKAFRNLKVLGYTSLNDIRMLDKKGNVYASLSSKTKQHVQHGCRYTETLQE